MQHEAEREKDRRDRRAPRRGGDGNLPGLAQHLREVAQQEDRKARGDRQKDHSPGPAGPRVAHGEARGDQHHRRHQKRQGQFHLEPDEVFARREARLFQPVDEGGQLPDRDRGRGSETVADLVGRQVRGQVQHFRLPRVAFGVGVAAETPFLRAEDRPASRFQGRLARVDALHGAAFGGEGDEGDVLERGAVAIGTRGVDHGLPVLAPLTQPDPFAGNRQHVIRPQTVAVRQVLVPFRGSRDDGVQDRHREATDHESRQQGRRQHAQRRTSGGADHDKFRGPRQREEERDRRQDHDQRQDAVKRGGHVQKRQFRRLAKAYVGGGEAADLFDHVDQVEDREEPGKDDPEHRHEAPCEVEGQRHDGTASPVAGRTRLRRPASASMMTDRRNPAASGR